MSIKMFSENSRVIVQSDGDVFVIKVSNDNNSINYFLSDEEVRELQILCEYHLQTSGVKKRGMNDE